MGSLNIRLLRVLTFRGEPLISTLSANLTRLGFDLSLAFLAADNKADLRLELWRKRNDINPKLRHIKISSYED